MIKCRIRKYHNMRIKHLHTLTFNTINIELHWVTSWKRWKKGKTRLWKWKWRIIVYTDFDPSRFSLAEYLLHRRRGSGGGAGGQNCWGCVFIRQVQFYYRHRSINNHLYVTINIALERQLKVDTFWYFKIDIVRDNWAVTVLWT